MELKMAKKKKWIESMQKIGAENSTLFEVFFWSYGTPETQKRQGKMSRCFEGWVKKLQTFLFLWVPKNHFVFIFPPFLVLPKKEGNVFAFSEVLHRKTAV